MISESVVTSADLLKVALSQCTPVSGLVKRKGIYNFYCDLSEGSRSRDNLLNLCLADPVACKPDYE